MKVDLKDFKRIVMLVDEEKNVAIFPISRTKEPVEFLGGMIDYNYEPTFHPIELKYPYTREELAEGIREGIEEWNRYECYPRNARITFEAKYYGVKSFRKAIKGKKLIYAGWDDEIGKYVSIQLPVKSCYGYLGISETILDEEADWIDFADEVIKYIEMDLTKLQSFKSFKRSLNL